MADVVCRDVVELVTEYSEGTLDAETAAAVRNHLTRCRGCEDYLTQMRTTVELVAHLPVESRSEPAGDELLVAFREFHARGSHAADR